MHSLILPSDRRFDRAGGVLRGPDNDGEWHYLPRGRLYYKRVSFDRAMWIIDIGIRLWPRGVIEAHMTRFYAGKARSAAQKTLAMVQQDFLAKP